MDKKDTFSQVPFSYQTTKNGLVLISYHGAVVTTLAGKAAARFSLKIQGLDEAQQQLLMAKATGHFKHGNEHQGQKRP